MDNLFLCLFPQTGRLLGVDGPGLLTRGVELKGIIFLDDAEGRGGKEFFHFKASLALNLKNIFKKKFYGETFGT